MRLLHESRRLRQRMESTLEGRFSTLLATACMGSQYTSSATSDCGAAAAVFHAGPSTDMHWLTGLGGAGNAVGAGSRGPTAMNGNAVMYEAGKILTVGGAPSFALVRPTTAPAPSATV